jgi:uncharacterized protein (DUF58 family)
MQNKDKIGLIGFHQETAVHLTPRRGRNHTMRLIREILAQQSTSAAGNLSHAVDELNRVARKRSVCFIISDFLDSTQELAALLQRARRRHDVVGLRIADPHEAQLPETSAPLLIHNPEGSDSACISCSAVDRKRYAAAYKEQRQRCEHVFRVAACDLVDIDTSDSCIAAIQTFFRRRRRQR